MVNYGVANAFDMTWIAFLAKRTINWKIIFTHSGMFVLEIWSLDWGLKFYFNLKSCHLLNNFEVRVVDNLKKYHLSMDFEVEVLDMTKNQVFDKKLFDNRFWVQNKIKMNYLTSLKLVHDGFVQKTIKLTLWTKVGKIRNTSKTQPKTKNNLNNFYFRSRLSNPLSASIFILNYNINKTLNAKSASDIFFIIFFLFSTGMYCRDPSLCTYCWKRERNELT